MVLEPCSNITTACLFPQFIKLHVREGVGVHDLHCGLKSYKFKLLGKLIV